MYALVLWSSLGKILSLSSTRASTPYKSKDICDPGPYQATQHGPDDKGPPESLVTEDTGAEAIQKARGRAWPRGGLDGANNLRSDGIIGAKSFVSTGGSSLAGASQANKSRVSRRETSTACSLAQSKLDNNPRMDCRVVQKFH